MRTKNPILIPDEKTLGWLAGLLEGEGWVGVPRWNVRGKDYWYLRIGVNMTDKDIIDRVSAIMGVKTTNQCISKTRSWSQKPQYRASASGERAAELMRLIYPLMGERRRRQIDYCFNKLKELRCMKL